VITIDERFDTNYWHPRKKCSLEPMVVFLRMWFQKYFSYIILSIAENKWDYFFTAPFVVGSFIQVQRLHVYTVVYSLHSFMINILNGVYVVVSVYRFFAVDLYGGIKFCDKKRPINFVAVKLVMTLMVTTLIVTTLIKLLSLTQCGGKSDRCRWL
jgi:hypothetical protein